ncbi:MAG: DTW domain-containing protein [Thermoanaerobaculia bacterium]|nr:DTW domain-containing protein [Thermoanaerobaculia bacterium]
MVCVCDRVETYRTSRRILVLQHPQEQDEVLGSAQLLSACLPQAQIVVGLSWRNFGHALGEDNPGRKRWAVLYPDRKAAGARITGAEGKPIDPTTLWGLVALDGTWSQAKALWWRNPWLSRLPRINLRPEEPSIYGRLRKEPSRHHVSTLESVAAALTACGEDPQIEAGLRRVFRTMVQRCRDAGPM